MVSPGRIVHRMSTRLLARKIWSCIFLASLLGGYLALYQQVMGGYSAPQQIVRGYGTNDTILRQIVQGYDTNEPVVRGYGTNETMLKEIGKGYGSNDTKLKKFETSNVTLPSDMIMESKMDNKMDDKMDRIFLIPYTPERSALNSSQLRFNCTNLHDIVLKRKLGNGVSKQVLLGHYKEHKVAVKMVTRTVPDVTSCTRRVVQQVSDANIKELIHKCYVFPNMKLMKEILLLQQLNHRNLLQMLGYCVRSEETESTSLQDHGVVAVYEYAVRFYTATLATWPLSKRLTSAWELADLLDYLEHSPLGSLHIADFKDAHFLLADGQHIKLTDMDDVSSQEPSCDEHGESCSYGLECIGGICPGHNAKANMDNMYHLLFQNLLQEDPLTPLEINIKLSDLLYRMQTLTMTAAELKQQLSSLRHMLKDNGALHH